MVDTRIEPPPIGDVSMAAAAAGAEGAKKMSSKGVESLKGAGGSLAEGGKAVLGAVKDMAVGGTSAAGGAVGGIAGFAKNIFDNALRIVGTAGKTVGGIMQKAPKTTIVVGLIAGVMALRAHGKKRGKQAELEQLRGTNDLGETALANNAMAGQLGAQPDLNPDAKADFVKKYGNRAAQQQSNLRA